MVIFLGVSPLWITVHNPLDFEARKQMLVEAYPDVNVLYIKDTDSDKLWSKRLDGMIADVTHPGQTAVLYGSRDSFIDHYEGRYPTRELRQSTWVSGSETRRQISRAKARASDDFRAGVIWASQARFPTAYGTVDVAVLDKDAVNILLVRKPDEPLFRFIGGFSEPTGASDEEDAAREVMEETGVTVRDLEYIGSTTIDDWRYRPEQDKIRTRFFAGSTDDETPNPQDDEIAEARWFPLDELRRRDLMPAHRQLLTMLREQPLP